MFLEGEVVLFKYRHALTGTYDNIALIVFDLAGQDFKESRFSRTIGTYDAVAITPIEFEVYILEEAALAKGQ